MQCMVFNALGVLLPFLARGRKNRLLFGPLLIKLSLWGLLAASNDASIEIVQVMKTISNISLGQIIFTTVTI